MAQKKFLSTGQFAKMCGTTKETLFHYDRAGLLKPKFTAANGYRYYQAEQFFDFDLICVLKDAGSSLKDIKSYLSNYDLDHFLSIVDEKRGQLEEQRRRLTHRLETLDRIARVSRSALRDQYGLVEVMNRPEELLLAAELGLAQGQEVTWDDSAEYLSRHFQDCEKLGLSTIFPVGYIIPRAGLLKGVFTESHLFSTLDKPLTSDRLRIKPAGRYASVSHRGGYDRLMEDLPGFLAEIEKRRLKIKGDAYVYALLSYLSSPTEENDVHRIDIPVR